MAPRRTDLDRRAKVTMGVRVERTSDTFVLKLGPIDALFAVKGRLDIPVSHITSVAVMDRTEVSGARRTWVRAPGTHIPGVLRFGSYGFEPQREFWLVRRQERVVVIEVRDWAYHRVVLGVPDPDALAALLRT